MAEEKLDKVLNKLDDISERLVKLETLIEGGPNGTSGLCGRLDKLEAKVAELERHRTQVVSFKDIATWTAMAAITIWGVLK